MLIKASEWINKNFEKGSRPNIKTVRKWIQQGIIEGSAINNLTYVEQDSKLPKEIRKDKGRLENDSADHLPQGLQDLLHKHRP